jgi:hypothetical protein
VVTRSWFGKGLEENLFAKIVQGISLRKSVPYVKEVQNPLRLEQSPVEPFATPATDLSNTTKKRRRKSHKFCLQNKTADKIGGFLFFNQQTFAKIR